MADYENYLMIDGLEEEVSELKNLKQGSKEHTLATNDAVKRSHAVLEEAKFIADYEEQAERRSIDRAKLDLETEKLEFERERAEMERERNDADREVRKYEAEVEERKSKRDLVGKIIGYGAIGVLTIGTYIFKNNDNILPRDELRFVDKIKP